MKRSVFMDPEEFSERKRMGFGALVQKSDEAQSVALVNPFAVRRSEPMDLVELAQEIQKADSFVKAVASAKIQVIAEQIKHLQQQALKCLMEAKNNSDLHHVACNFRKVPGHIYYLYERPSGQKYFSMLSRDEWDVPHCYLGAYRLELDNSWTPESEIQRKNLDQATIEKFLNFNGNDNMYALTDSTGSFHT